MKLRWHWAFYAAAAIATIGMFAQWSWVKAGFDGWFPVAMVAFGQLARIRSGAPETFLDRTFASRKAERFAILSVVAVLLGISAWFAYFKYVYLPMSERAGVEEYLAARAKILEERRAK